jgi:steroid 5-alpha reductase family enzyme
MVSSPWLLVAISAGVAAALMVIVWAIAVRIGNASYVDVAWAYGVGGAGLLDAALADGCTPHRLLVAVLATIWSARLGTFILTRLAGKEEDGRYQELRRRWAPNVNRAFFVFFQAQAGFVTVFSLPFAFVAVDGGRVSLLAWFGAAIALGAIAGETTADRQLTAWRNDPANKGRTCRAGLWNLSRHPNYFFEWLHWVAWAVIALASPTGWVAVVVPVFLLVLLFRVTGIPETEAQALRSRGDDYRRYQAEVSIFVPWPRSRA